MPVELKIPAVGESITEVQIGEWLKAEGDIVKQDEPVAVVDSEKSTFELPAPQNGRLVKILHQAGETVPVGTVVAHIEPGAAEAKAQPNGAPAAVQSEKPEPPETAVPTPSDPHEPRRLKAAAGKQEEKAAEPGQQPAKDTGKQPGAPAAKEGKEKPAPVSETAPSRKPAKEAATGGREEEVVPMTMLRRTVARRLVEASQTMAMLTTFNEADMSAVQALRGEFQEAFEKRNQVKLGLMSFFIKAAVDALKQFPQLNAEVRGDNIVYHNYCDIGVAVGTERGLVVPVLRSAERLSFAEIERAITDFAHRAKEGGLNPEELSGGTFTITNGGVFGSLLSTPIINPPQTGILGLHSIQERPVAVQGQVVVRPMMYVALTYDHRIVDGREAVLFLRRVKQAIESPARMLLEI